MIGSPRGRPVLGAAASAVALLALAPLCYLVIRAFDGGTEKAWGLLFRQRTLDLMLRSIALTVVVAVSCVVLGVGLAWLTTRTDLPLRRFFGVCLTIPLAIPSYVAGYTWISQFPSLAGFAGAALVLTASSFPLVMLPVSAALASADPGMSEVARTLGRSEMWTVLTVELRRVAPVAAAGALLAALYTLSDFGAVALMRYEAFTLGIYNAYRGGFDRTAAAILGLVLVVLALVCTLIERWVRRGATARIGSGTPRRAEPVRLGWWRIPASMCAIGVLTMSVLVPLAGLMRWLARSVRFTIDWSDVLATTVKTVELSATAAVVVTVLAFPVALFAARSSSSAARMAEISTYVAHGLPGITVGLAVVFLGIRFLPSIYQTTTLLIVAYVVLFLPLAVGSTRSAIDASPLVLEDVSRVLGSGRVRTDLRVTIPIALPAVTAGAALVFLTVAKELPATLMLRPRGVDTLATELWSTAQVFKYGEAAPYALALILVSALPTFVLGRVLRGNSVGGRTVTGVGT
ncbi:iron(III) transport system permease protein [Rhodococcus sp. SMB37]|nr:iron(III) transport system permease protein [Rhodococcus sp. SMB37]